MPFELTDSFIKNWGSRPNFDKLMSLEGELYKQMAQSRRKTFKFEVNGAEYFIKIHKGVGWPEIFKNLMQGRLPVLGAKNEFDGINKLTKLGVKTMTLAAYGQRGRNLAELDSFVITESLEPSVSLEDFCANWSVEKPPLKLKRALIKRVATIAKQLHENGVNHRDFYICHFLIKKTDIELVEKTQTLPLYVIDLHRAQIRPKTPKRWIIKDVAALYYSSMNIGFTKRDFYRFIREYTGNELRTELNNHMDFWSKVESKALYLYSK